MSVESVKKPKNIDEITELSSKLNELVQRINQLRARFYTGASQKVILRDVDDLVAVANGNNSLLEFRSPQRRHGSLAPIEQLSLK